LPQMVDVEVRGVPAHVWKLETAEHLLDEWCWVHALHPDTVQRRDYSSFRLSAWCSSPERIPAAMDLVVVEPPAPVVEVPPVKRALSYAVSITVVPGDGRLPEEEAPPAPPPACGGGRRRRRRDSSSSSSSLQSPAKDSPSRGVAPRSLELADSSGHDGRAMDAVAPGASPLMAATKPAPSPGAPSATAAPSQAGIYLSRGSLRFWRPLSSARAGSRGERTQKFRRSRRLI